MAAASIRPHRWSGQGWTPRLEFWTFDEATAQRMGVVGLFGFGLPASPRRDDVEGVNRDVEGVNRTSRRLAVYDGKGSCHRSFCFQVGGFDYQRVQDELAADASDAWECRFHFDVRESACFSW